MPDVWKTAPEHLRARIVCGKLTLSGFVCEYDGAQVVGGVRKGANGYEHAFQFIVPTDPRESITVVIPAADGLPKETFQGPGAMSAVRKLVEVYGKRKWLLRSTGRRLELCTLCASLPRYKDLEVLFKSVGGQDCPVCWEYMRGQEGVCVWLPEEVEAQWQVHSDPSEIVQEA